jgi:RNA polymerase sigma-70 factor (ECF subfamily)
VTSPDEDFEQLLLAARANAEWAWRELYIRYAPTVLQFLRSQRARDPDGLLGDVFVDVVRSLHTFTGSGAEFRSWLFRIANNRFLDERRAEARRPEHPTDDPAAHQRERAAAAAEVVHGQLDEERLLRLLGILPGDQRAAVYMRVVLELPPADIAAAMGRRVGSVKMLITRGLASLRERFGDDMQLPG